MMPLRRRRILVLTPRLPYPPHGGDRLRIHRVCATLAKYFELTLLSLCENEPEMRMKLPDDGIFQRVERVLLSPRRSKANCLWALPTRRPLQVAYFHSPAFARRVAELLPQHDTVYAHLIRTGEYVRDFRGPKFLEMTDAIALKYERMCQSGANLRSLGAVYQVELSRLRRYETAIVGDFDETVVVSDVDREYLIAGGAEPSRLMRCTNGFDPDLPYQFNPDGRTIVLIGNMTSVQNLDAARYFIDDVLPLLRQRRPELRFRIVGRIDDADASSLARYEGVEITHEVPSIAQAAAGGSVGICPIRFGSGVQNKILDCMALGIPVVSSSIGHEGLAAGAGKELAVADAPAEFARACLALVEDRELAQRQCAAARRYVENQHDWQNNLAPLIERIHDVLQARGRAPASRG